MKYFNQLISNNIGLPYNLTNNIYFLSEDEIVYSCGSNFQVVNINTLERKSYLAQDIKGIGCIAVSFDKRYIAVGECGYFPNILIYEYDKSKDPNIRLYRILRKGTENAYSALCFNHDGTYIASAGSDPDHNLIIWHWKTESIILKAKAFSQEVFTVTFSDNFEGKLYTSGMGHIKFWEMAKTFTGLKLQGELGKFGQVDLSDVSAYLEFPDGKVLCGTEHGTLLLWEGIFIKTQVFIDDNIPCHGILEDPLNKDSKENLDGKETNENADEKSDPANTKDSKPNYTNKMMDVMFWEGESTIITAGHDGYIKWWNFLDFENAEIDDNFKSCIKPVKSTRILNPTTNLPVKIVSLISNYRNKDLISYLNKAKSNNMNVNDGLSINDIKQVDPNNMFWIIQDGNGFILRINLKLNENLLTEIKNVVVVFSGFSGSILTATPLENTPYILAEAADSKISLINNISPENFDEKIIASYSNVQGLMATTCTVLTPISESEDPLVIFTGYRSGLVMVKQYNNNNKSFDLVNQIKVHDDMIKFIKVSPDRSWLLSATETEIFIQLIQTLNNITPLFYITKKEGINDIDWQTNSKHFLLALNDGSVEQISVQAMPNTSDTYEISNYELKKLYIRHSYLYVDAIDDKKKKKFKQNEEACKGKVYSVKSAGMYLEDDFFVTCAEPYENFIQLCSFELDKIPNHDCTIEDGVYNNLRPTHHWKVKKPRLVNTRLLGGHLPRGDDIKHLKNELYVKLFSKDLLVVANMNGSGIVQIHHKQNLTHYIEIYANPSNNNILCNAMSYNKNPLLNFCYSDGTITSYLVDVESMISYINYYNLNYTTMKEQLKDDFNEDDYLLKLHAFIKTELFEMSKINQENNENVVKQKYLKGSKEATKYLKQYIALDLPIVDTKDFKTLKHFLEMRSLEKIKKDAELEARQKKADEKKNKLKEKISALREDFISIYNKNESASEEIKLQSDEMVVDEVYIETIQKTINDNLDDVRHKYDWHKAIVQGSVNRLEEFFLKSVKTHVVKLYTISRDRPTFYVTSIRCPALPDNFDEALSELEKLIEEYKTKISFEALEQEYEKHMVNNDGSNDVKEDDILNKVALIKGRIEDFYARTNVKSGERVNFGKDQIKNELDLNALDMKNLEHFKKNIDKSKPVGGVNMKRGSVVERKIKCPERYTLKLNYDVFYTEELMKTTFEHKLEILNFLKVIYESREEFNNELFKLREKKMKIIQEAKLNKQKLMAINNELGIRSISTDDPKMGYENTGKYVFPPDAPTENLDWLNLEMKDDEFTDNFLRIKPEELEHYVQDKYKQEKEPKFILLSEEEEKQQQIKIQEQGQSQANSSLAFPYNGGNFNNPHVPVYNELKLQFKDRGTKKHHNSLLFEKMKEISQIKLNYKKKKLIEESKEMIENFDKDIRNLRKKKLDTHFKQKLGELELFIKHEEYNILRAFETDDKILIEKLEELCQNYRNNLSDLNAIEVIINELEAKVKQKKAEREEKIAEFYKYIEAEKENRSKLEKIYFTKTKKSEGKEGEDRLDNEEDLENDRPKNVTPTMYNEIILKRENRETLDSQIENFEKSIETNKKTKQNRIHTKLALDKKREEVRFKINSQERKKSKYLNLIEISFPIKIDQFCKFIGGEHSLDQIRLSLDISKAVLISRNKLKKLDDLEDKISLEIDQYKIKENKISLNKVILDKAKKQAIVEEKDCRDGFVKEQNLKFGTEINFENLLKAARDTTADKLDYEYKQLKKDADILLDSKKELEDALKKEYQNEVNINTALLHKIKKLLNDNKQYDKNLEEKNNEINKKKEKKYELFNVQEKKEKLKEILKLLQQQMEALKKENEIFRKKGGHIYSTITSNLN